MFPLALMEFFSRQVFRNVNSTQRAKSLTRAFIRQLLDGVWRNFEVGKAFETACMHIGPHVDRTCDRDGNNGNALTVFCRK
jgi:hypothetical protein